MSKNAACIIGLVASVLVAISAQANVFGAKAQPWCLLAGIIGTAISGWLAKSPLDHSNSSGTVSTKGLQAVVLASAIGLGAVTVTSVSSCASASPRHDITGSVTAVLDALTAAEAAGDAGVSSGAITTAQRQALAKVLLPALTAAKAVNDTTLAWTPGAPLPSNLVTLISNLQGLVTGVGGLALPPATLATINGYIAGADSALIVILADLPAPTPATGAAS